MRVPRIIWLPDIEDKLSEKHAVLAEEVEEILFDSPHIRFVEKGHREDEDLYAAYGQTTAGRWLIVFFILKEQHKALIISARDMDRKERRLYARR
jgi:uncharacterized DUF497 family protein